MDDIDKLFLHSRLPILPYIPLFHQNCFLPGLLRVRLRIQKEKEYLPSLDANLCGSGLEHLLPLYQKIKTTLIKPALWNKHSTARKKNRFHLFRSLRRYASRYHLAHQYRGSEWEKIPGCFEASIFLYQLTDQKHDEES